MEGTEGSSTLDSEMTRQIAFMHLVRGIDPIPERKYNICTFGCQMNENDSEKLKGMLEAMGYDQTDDLDSCDLVLYNTCCVRENAENKVYGHLGMLKDLKSRKPDTIIVLCGCMMQQKKVTDYISRKFRHVDLIFGTHNLYRFPELLYKFIRSGKKIFDICEDSSYVPEGIPVCRDHKIKAWITVMYGCNNFCSYCIVPYVRGRERSRKQSDIIREAIILGKEGYKEITLLGQNVNSYGIDLRDGNSFAGLLYKLNEVEGIERLRFMTSHPKDLTEDVIMAMRDCGKVCEHLHLPVQAGSNRILKEMNRRYTREHYLELIDRIRSEIPGISLTTDIIVGYPGESGEDFEQTMELVERVRFDYMFTFLYSKRTGTPAATAENHVSEETMKRRFRDLVSLQNSISKELNKRLKGETVEVLVEGQSRNNANVLTGRTRTNKIVNFKADENLTGQIRDVRILESGTWSLEGELI